MQWVCSCMPGKITDETLVYPYAMGMLMYVR